MSRSQELFSQAKNMIPGGVNSPVRAFRHVGRDPIYFAKGEGPYLYDVDGKQYVDFCLSFGPHILGHSPDIVVKAVQEQARLAMSYGACHPGEVELASLILKGYPFLERARLLNSGTEAVMTAVRIARGFTGRSKILKFEGCYHGHSDGFLSQAGSGVAELSEATSSGVPKGVVQDVITCPYDDIKAVEQIFKTHGKQLAAVILEPVPANHGLWEPLKARLEEICMLAKLDGALLIFDEVITGFRLGLSGACGYYDLRPDIVTLGKIIGGGLPLAAVAGTKAVMEMLAPVGPVYQAGTLSGNPLATAAGSAVLKELFTRPPYEDLAKKTTWFSGELKNILSTISPVKMVSLGSLFWFSFGESHRKFPYDVTEDQKKAYAQFFEKALNEGVYFAPSPYEVGFLSATHSQTVLESVLEKITKCLK